ncbi:MAG: glycosyltransferase [Lachnospiraceae bacterium]|nr:glycosyltransferase [Lachnospiraceae bacterium]
MKTTEQIELPLLTVVVPLYNGEIYIEETLKHILCSDYHNIEVILIDDGSCDESSKIVQRVSQIDNRVCYTRTENSGIVAARNKGIELASGEYICFCDQDDIVEPSMYRLLLERILENNAQMGICSTGRWIDGQKSKYESLVDGCYREKEVRECLLYPILFRGYNYPFVKKEHYLYGTIWKCIFNKKFLEEYQQRFVRFVDYEDDWIFVTQALTKAQCVVTVSEVGYYWRINQDSKSHTKSYIPDAVQRFQNLERYVEHYLTDAMNSAHFELYKKVALCEHYADCYRNVAHAMLGKDRKQAREELKKYLRTTHYKKQLSCLQYLQKTAFRKKILYTSLKYLGIYATFVVDRVLLWLERQTGRMQWFVQWERKMKLRK